MGGGGVAAELSPPFSYVSVSVCVCVSVNDRACFLCFNQSICSKMLVKMLSHLGYYLRGFSIWIPYFLVQKYLTPYVLCLSKDKIKL